MLESIAKVSATGVTPRSNFETKPDRETNERKTRPAPMEAVFIVVLGTFAGSHSARLCERYGPSGEAG